MHKNHLNRKWQLFLAAMLVTLTACNSPTATNSNSDTSSPANTINSPENSPTATDNNTNVDASRLISTQGIGDARLGMTYGELKKALDSKTTYEVKSPFMVDFDAIAVNQDGKTLYYITYPSTDTFSDSSKIETITTENPDFLTDKGVGVGKKIKDAETAYGKATLGYHTQNESREYVTFANQPSDISFRPLTPPGKFAGIYKSPLKEYNETDQFKQDTVIKSVSVLSRN
ncbi:hypothetical protein Riv7116_0204 [Rivularia sp. PCC 7116]|uniref:hypothetical protein n=1 Tax=Rivularia sp. PCC 7116 TaxID=373994 RepID=UPI00029F4C41|nr:hypothetical protein [Rivularia sp. PCC 7116]AFY52812.1 hypothetical protein Riv7116_0204 [Rivularia sp. PCC 7116]